MGYVVSSAIEFQNPNLEGLLIYYFCLIFEAFQQEGIQLNKITEQDIEDFEKDYMEVLNEYFEKENEEILEDYIGQTDLIKFMMIEVSTEDEDGTSLDDKTATQLFIVTIAMIGLMNRAIKE